MYYFIINPVSGSGRGRRIWKTLRKELNRLKISYEGFVLSGPGEAKKLAESLCELKQPATVIAVGGDGTINEVISGLHSYAHITFGCIPTGSGNDFVRGLGLPKEPLEALQAILHPTKTMAVNIGQAVCPGEAPLSFIVSSGFGYDAAVCYEAQISVLKKIMNFFHSGKLVYLLKALQQLMTMKLKPLRVTIDDGKPVVYEKTYFAAAMNLMYEGGGFMFCPDALPDDGWLDFILVCGISRLRALTLLPLALSGKHVDKEGIHILRCRKVSLSAPESLYLHTDGEIPGSAKEITYFLKDEKLPVILG